MSEEAPAELSLGARRRQAALLLLLLVVPRNRPLLNTASRNSSSSLSSSSSSSGLLSSPDAFEASFASAFPETSFSITSDITPGPLSSSATLDMSFDVPDFDPFFKGPSPVVVAAASAGSSSNSNKQGDATTTSMGLGAGATGGGGGGGGGKAPGVVIRNSNHCSGSSSSSGTTTMMMKKNQTIQDLFPESAMNFKTGPKLDILAFDSNPMTTPLLFDPMEQRMMGGPMPSSVTSTTHQTSAGAMPLKQQRGSGIGGGFNSSSIGIGHSQLSPHSITAEIEQLDAIANLASSIGTSSTAPTTAASSSATTISGSNFSSIIPSSRTALRSSGRKVRQPASYAEPSTKSKLRRGDVLFPKVDPVLPCDNNNDNKGGGSGAVVGRTMSSTLPMTTRSESPTTDLGRIMGQIASTSSSSTSSSPEATTK